MDILSFQKKLSALHKIIVVITAASFYIIGFYFSFPYMGVMAGGLGLIPVITAGILCGKRGAFYSFFGVFTIGLLLLYFNDFDFAAPLAIIQISIGNLFILVSALTIGWTSSLIHRVQQQNQALDAERLQLNKEIERRSQSELNLRKQQEFSDTLQQGLALLSANLDESTVLDSILQQIKRAVFCDSVSILLSENDILVVHANLSQAKHEDITSTSFPINEESNNPGVKVFQNKLPIKIDNTADHPGWVNIPALTEIKSWVGIPLLLNGQAIGVIGIERFTNHPFTQTEIQLLQAFTRPIVLTIENTRLYQHAQQEIGERKRTEEKLHKRLQTEALISSFSTQLLNTDTSNIEHNVQEVLKKLGEYTEADRCYLSMFAPNKYIIMRDFTWTNGQVQLRKADDQINDIRFLPWVYKKLSAFEIINIPDVKQLGENASKEKARWESFGIQSLLLIPIVRNNILLGVLGFHAETKKANWSQEDIVSLQLMANIFSSFWARHTAEKDQIEKLLFVEGLLDAIPAPIFYIDPNGVYLGCNKAFCASYGTEKEYLIGKTAFDFNPKERAEYLLSIDFDLMSKKESATYEEPSTFADGNEHFLIVHKAPFYDFDGKTAGLIAVMADVTAQKELEKALQEERSSLAEKVIQQTMELRQANVELAQAAKAKDEFLAAMSHELRTPLNAILGLSEALHEKIYGPVNNKQEETLNRIQENGSHLLALISDILDLAKIGAGRMELDKAPVDVNYICETTISMLSEIAQNKGISLDLKMDPQVKIILADGRRLKQILLNLLSNAIKFTSNGGKVSLEMLGDLGSNLVHFHIRDNGIGIAEEDITNLFTPFQQIDSSLSRKYDGAGLGLALAAQMASLHNGNISVESTPGIGSHFCVSFPWTPDTIIHNLEQNNFQIQEASLSLQNTTLSNPLILIAEDDPATRETMSDYLRAKGFRVKTADNGLLALKQAKSLLPDLILMDIQMPEMDGLETTIRIREEDALAHIPIIAITALAMPGDKEKCLLAGANDYLVKPVQLSNLVETIQSNLI
jgi:PAS domain S-box-containing protein